MTHMNLKTYQRQSATTDLTPDQYLNRLQSMPAFKTALLHYTVGISTEAGELGDTLKRYIFYQQPLDVANIKEELGDLLWYMTRLASALGITLEEILEHNSEKLSKRYHSGKFTEEHATERADKDSV